MFSVVTNQIFQKKPFNLIARGMNIMSNYIGKKIYPKLNRVETDCLHRALKNEFQRWDDIISLSNKKGNFSLASDYENDSIKLENLIAIFDQYEQTQENSQEISFGQRDAAFIIETVDHEFYLWKKGNSSFKKEEFRVIENTRKKITELAVNEYGPEILELAHYERGKD